MINAGFNPLQQISEKTGKSIATLKEEMGKGAISAEMVQQAFLDATAAGGKFYNMSENASKTINGQISMMQDALDNVFNELGTKGESVIMSGIQMTTSLIENYETVGKVLTGLMVTYGAYRTAVMLVTAAESKHTLVEIGLTNARVLARKAQLALNAAMLTNPYVLLAVAVGGLITANLTLLDTNRQLKAAEDDYNKTKDEAITTEQKLKAETDKNLSVAENYKAATEDRKDALVRLIQKYPAIFEKYKTETEMLQHILDIHKEIDKYEKNRSVTNSQNELANVNKQIADLEKLAKQRYHGGRGLTNAENAKLTMLKNKRSELEGSLKKEETDAILADLTGYSNSQIEAAIKDRERLLVKMQLKGVDKGTITGKSILSGTFSKNELEGQKKLLEATKAEREAEKKSSAEWLANYKKAYEDADKAYNDFLKSKEVMSDADRDKELKRLKGLRDTAESTYKSKGGSDSSDKKQESAAEKLRKETDRYKLLLSKQALEEIRASEDLQMQVDEANNKRLAEGSEKTIDQIELNFEKEMQAIDRQKEDALRKKIENARSAWEANPENKGKSFNATGIALSDDEQQYYDELYKAAIASNEKAYFELANQYLSYTDQRLEIEKKFNDDVAILLDARKKAEEKGDSNEVARIDRSIGKRTEIKNEDAFKLDAEQFKKNMNWEQVFGNLDKVSTDTLKKLEAKLKDFIAAQKDLSPEGLKELVDALERIDEKVSERNPFEAMATSFKSLKDATDAEHEAQKAYNKVLKEGTDEEKKSAKATLESAKNNKQKALAEATISLHKGVDEIGQYVEAGNQVIGIMETLGLNTPKWLEGAMTGFGEILNGLGSIDLAKPMSIITGSLQTIKGALTSVVSLGGLIPGLGGADYSRYNKMVEEYNQLNEIWDELIDKKLEYIGISYGAEADKVGKEALDIVGKQIEAYRKLGKERLNSGASAGSHSIGKRMAKNTSSSDWQDIANAIGMSVSAARDFIGTGRMTGLFDLTAEQLEKLKSEAPVFWAKMDDDVQDYLDGIINGEEKIEDIQKQIQEQLTQTTFDSVFDSFVDLLMDMDSSAEDFADNFEEYMQRAILTTMVGDKYKAKLQAWYDNFAKANDDEAGITKEEMEQSQKEWEDIVAEALAERNALKDAMGWTGDSESTSQSSTLKGFGTEMTHEDAGELNGRFTALQVAGEEIKNQNVIQSQSLNLLTMKTDDILRVDTEVRNIADDTRNLIANSYLELVQISENTGNSAKYLKDIKADIAEVKRNTSKL